MKSKWLVGAFLALAILPAFAFADHINPNTNVWSPRILTGPLVVCYGNYIGSGGSPASTIIDSSGNTHDVPALPPCQNLCDLVAQIVQIIYFIIGVGIWVLLPITIGYAGVKIILARGNPAKASEARKAATGALWGVVIMLCAWLIVSTFVGFFKLGDYIGGFGAQPNCIVSNTPPAQ